MARAPWAVVIDGDLQHPPEMVPSLLRAGLSTDVDLVYGTRYVGSGDAGGLNGRVRERVSRLSTILAKAVFPHRLRGVSDPMMSGFFRRPVAGPGSGEPETGRLQGAPGAVPARTDRPGCPIPSNPVLNVALLPIQRVAGRPGRGAGPGPGLDLAWTRWWPRSDVDRGVLPALPADLDVGVPLERRARRCVGGASTAAGARAAAAGRGRLQPGPVW